MQILEVVVNEPIRPTIVNHSRPIWCVEQAEARSMQGRAGRATCGNRQTQRAGHAGHPGDPRRIEVRDADQLGGWMIRMDPGVPDAEKAEADKR